jgi:hypothetical protein
MKVFVLSYDLPSEPLLAQESCNNSITTTTRIRITIIVIHILISTITIGLIALTEDKARTTVAIDIRHHRITLEGTHKEIFEIDLTHKETSEIDLRYDRRSASYAINLAAGRLSTQQRSDSDHIRNSDNMPNLLEKNRH